MPAPCTVVIGPADLLDALKDRIKEAGEVLLFGDAEALRALDAIYGRKPRIVALERTFAATSRGAALISRVKADPALDGCEIRVVAHDSDSVRVSRSSNLAELPMAEPERPPVVEAPPVLENATRPQAVVTIEVAPAAPPSPLDYRGTRRAPRSRIRDGVEVLVDGNPAVLIDLSVAGAQVVSPTVLRPNQRVRVTLTDETGAIRFNGAIAWASFELSRRTPTPQYRAGIVFVDANEEAVDDFCLRHRRDS